MNASVQSRMKRVSAVVAAAVALGAASRAMGADAANASAIMQRLEHDPSHASITVDALSHARVAVDTAARLRDVGDEMHARAADGLALEWAETARDLARAADAEATASDLRHKAVDAQARLERARAMVEEEIARVGRIKAELDEASGAALKNPRGHEGREGDPSSRTDAGSQSSPPPKGAASADRP